MAKKTITVQLDEEIFQSMQTLAENNARSRNSEIGVALKRYIAQELDGLVIQTQQSSNVHPAGEVTLTPAAAIKDTKGLL